MLPIRTVVITLLLLIAHLPALSIAQPVPRLRVQGQHLVDPAGKPVTLRGVNLGNWLLIETWMLGWGGIPDQYTVHKILSDRFGPSEADRLIALYRDHYITPRDFAGVKSFNFNLVRLPFAWDLLQNDTPPYALREDAFKYLDRALQMAQDAGIYVILDLHGAPGGQSKEHHTYREAQNKLFSTPENLDRTVAIWSALAERYKNHPNIVGYDLLNEPYGDYQQDLSKDLISLMDRLYAAVRAHDPDTLIFYPGAIHGGIEFYGNPAAKNQKNVGFTEHFYPGLFGDPTRVGSHNRHFKQRVAARDKNMREFNVPFLVGEFNVVLEAAGGDPMMRKHFDTYAELGWLSTAWSYKLLKPAGGSGPDNWYFATNANPLPPFDLRTSSLAEIESFFTSLSTMPIAFDETLRAALSSPTPPPIIAPPIPNLPDTAPSDPPPAGWALTPVNSPLPAGGYLASPPTLVAGGSDIWTNDDSFLFLSQSRDGDFEVSVTLTAFGDTDRYAKAGLMVRTSAAKDAAHVFVNLFPNKNLGFSTRPAIGARMTEAQFDAPAQNGLPIRLKLVRKGDTVTAYSARGTAEFERVGSHPFPKGSALVGLAVCSHDDTQLTAVPFNSLKLTAP